MVPKQIALILLIALFAGACSQPGEDPKWLQSEAIKRFGALPDVMPGAERDTPERIALGEKLFFDTILSRDNTIACSSCHRLNERGNGTDNRATSIGIDGQKGRRNAPSVWNAGYQFAQFWDGRAESLKEQAGGPILNTLEMGMPDEKSVISKLKKSRDYRRLFALAFPDDRESLTFENLTEAIAAFERTLKSRNRLDDFIAGNLTALNKPELVGLQIFIESGCSSCHNGPLLGGNRFKRLGRVNNYDSPDRGRQEITGNPDDAGVFKIPSLRNIELTAPYFHDGSIPTLDEAVRVIAWHQLGMQISESDKWSILTFLRALSDEKLKRQ